MLPRMIDPNELLLELHQNRLNQQQREARYEKLTNQAATGNWIVFLGVLYGGLWLIAVLFAITSPQATVRLLWILNLVPMFAIPVFTMMATRTKALEELIRLEAPELYVRLAQRGVLRARRE